MGRLPIVLDASLVPHRGSASPSPEGDADLSARVAVSWDEKYLYLAAQVRDDEKTSHAAKDRWGSPFVCDRSVVIIAERVTFAPGAPLRYVGTIAGPVPGVGQLPLPALPEGQYEVRVVWK